MRFTFESTFPDGSPRRFVGMHRPPPFPFTCYVMLEGGHIVRSAEELSSIYASGRFDRPLYAIEDDELAEVCE